MSGLNSCSTCASERLVFLDSCRLSFNSRRLPRPKQNIRHVMDILFIRHRFDRLRGERDERFEVFGEFREDVDAGDGFQFVAADEGLEGEAAVFGGGALAEAGFQVRILAKGVELAREELVQIRLGVFGIVDDDGAGGDVAETLGSAGDEARDAADQITRGQADRRSGAGFA